MKRNLSPAKLPLILGALVLALTGCATKSICIMTVDASTEKPLTGVTTEWREHRHQMFRPLTHYGPTNLPPSDQNGLIKIHRLHRNWRSTFIFSCPGYPNLFGSYQGNVLTFGTKVIYYPLDQLDGEFRFDGEWETAFKSNKCFVIAMPK